MSLFASLVCATNWFHPFALGMAAGVGSGSMMTAAAGTVANLYPEFSEEILLYGSTSDVLTGVDGVYLGTFIGRGGATLVVSSGALVAAWNFKGFEFTHFHTIFIFCFAMTLIGLIFQLLATADADEA